MNDKRPSTDITIDGRNTGAGCGGTGNGGIVIPRKDDGMLNRSFFSGRESG